jgi:hypothetical protein
MDEMDETIMAFMARSDRHFAERLREKDRELERAKRALASARLSRDNWKRRACNAMEEVDRLRESFRGTGPSAAHHTAILAALRVKRAIG